MAIRYLSGINVDSNTLFVDSSNNRVGIGTASPSQLLHINAASGAVYTRIQNNNNSLYLGLESGGIAQVSSDTSSLKVMANTFTSFETAGSERMRIFATNGVSIGKTTNAFGTSTRGSLEISGSTDSIMALYSGSTLGGYVFHGGTNMQVLNNITGGSLEFYTQGTERARFTSGGNFLIGTTTDTGYKLNVVGEVSFSPNTAGKNTFTFTTNAANDARLLLKSDTTTKVDIQANGVSYFNGGNVGIGTASPSVALHTNGFIRSANSGNTVYTEVQNDGLYATGTDLYLLAPSTKFISFYAGGAERMRITSDGSLQVGTTSQTYNNATYGYVASFKGAVSTQAYISVALSNQASTSEGMLFGLTSSTGDIYVLDNKPLVLYTNSTEKMRIAAGGNVLIGTTTDSGYKLDVSGTGRFSGNLTLGNGLSERIISASSYIEMYNTSTGDMTFYSGFATASINFCTGNNASPKLTIASNGAIKFSAYGSGTITGTAAYNLGVDSSGNVIELPGGVVDGSGTANYVTKWQDANTITDSNIIADGTSVGVGVISPQSRLDIATSPAQGTIATLGYSANANINIRIPNTVADVGQIVFTNASAPTAGYAAIGVVMTSGSSVGLGDLIFATKSVGTDAASQERMRITSTGNVLIGTTTDAGYKLDVSGDVRANFYYAQNSTTTGTTIQSYGDQFKKVWTTLTSFSFTGAGVYYFNLVFQTDQGFTYDLTATTSRNELWRNFGSLRDNSYLNVESDGDFETYAVGDVQMISNDMYLDAVPTAFKSATTTASGVNGTSPWAYYIVRYAIYIPNYAGNTNGFFKVHLTTYGYEGNAPLFINA